MSKPLTSTTVDQAFFQPLSGLAAQSAHARPCPEFSDEDFLRLGVQRVLESCESGRAFLQEHGVRFENAPGSSNYFAALQSERRGAVLGEVNLALVAATNPRLHDRLADIPELADYECFAADGHWHQAAVHDARHEGTKMAVGHFCSLNLRTNTLRHLAAGQGLHEHDMSALKRIKPKGLRQGVPKGRRVLIIYDKAGIDFGYWKRCRQECAVYFLSRVSPGYWMILLALHAGPRSTWIMSRKLRVEYPRAIYHVVNRGDRREPIFREDADRQLFLDTLGQACVKAGWQVHAYCLMGNHFHLVVETPQGNLVAGMKWFLGIYTGGFNRKHKLFGHLFSGRYKALVVDGHGDGYLQTACEYVHLNPARAKLLQDEQPLSAYRGSSYVEYLKRPRCRAAWLRVDRLFGEIRIGRDDATGRRR